MKQRWNIVTLIFLACSSTVLAKGFEDFSGDRFDLTKWQSPQQAILIENGKLVIQADVGSGDTPTIQPEVAAPLLTGVGAAQVTTFVTGDLDTEKGEDHELRSYMKGNFYKANSGRLVHALIALICRSPLVDNTTSCEVVYRAQYEDNEEDAGTEGWPVLGDPFAMGEEVTIGISYDGNQTLTFSRNGESVDVVGPAKSSTPLTEEDIYLYLCAGARSAPDSSSNFKATFDNFQASGGFLAQPVADTFDGPFLDSSIWLISGLNNEVQGTRLIKNGVMELSARNNRVNKIQIDNRLQEDFFTDYFQADITIDSSTTFEAPSNEGRQARVELNAFRFNELISDGSYDGELGEASVNITLAVNADRTINARAAIWTCGDANCETPTPNGVGLDLDCEIEFDQPVTLFIERHGKSFTFGCNDSTITLPDFGGEMYKSQWSALRRIRARAYSTNDYNSYVKAYVDNVYITKPNGFVWSLYLPTIQNGAQKR